MSAPLVERRRGALVDALHRGDLALVAADGALEASVGDPRGRRVYWRSAAKPFQALPVVSSGAAIRWGLSGEDLAMIAGSHNGEPMHVERVRALLERIGLGAQELACGTHPPLDPAAARALEQRGESPGPEHNNCSAKHVGMLALAEHMGVERRGYWTPEHPVQREILAHVAHFAGLAPAHIAIGLDGCGVPCFGTSVYHLALAFARLVEPDGAVTDSEADAARAIAAAMAAHPYLVAGRNRLDTELMLVGAGALIVKGGADGVQCVGLRGGLGLAVKIEDGAAATAPGRPPGFVAIEALRQLGFLGHEALVALGDHARPRVETLSRRPAGDVRATFRLTSTAEAPCAWAAS